MKNYCFAIFAILFFAACNQHRGSGRIITEKREIADFSAVNVGAAFEVELKNGPVCELTVEADDNLIGFIETEVDGEELKISTEGNLRNGHFKIYLSAPQINAIEASGASQVIVEGQLKNEREIQFHSSGASQITANVDAPEIEADLSGAGNITLMGRTKDFVASVSGSGNLKSGELRSENTEVRVSGAGNASVYASVNLKAKASGAGNIYYKGGATVQQHTSGAGKVMASD